MFTITAVSRKMYFQTLLYTVNNIHIISTVLSKKNLQQWEVLSNNAHVCAVSFKHLNTTVKYKFSCKTRSVFSF